jgi:ferredoxin
MTCELCGRDQPLTFHHLIPRAVHSKKRFQRQFSKEEMQTRGLMICRKCHSGIHDIIPDEKELAESYNTKEALLAHEGIAKHVAWVAKQKRKIA